RGSRTRSAKRRSSRCGLWLLFFESLPPSRSSRASSWRSSPAASAAPTPGSGNRMPVRPNSAICSSLSALPMPLLLRMGLEVARHLADDVIEHVDQLVDLRLGDDIGRRDLDVIPALAVIGVLHAGDDHHAAGPR